MVECVRGGDGGLSTSGLILKFSGFSGKEANLTFLQLFRILRTPFGDDGLFEGVDGGVEGRAAAGAGPGGEHGEGAQLWRGFAMLDEVRLSAAERRFDAVGGVSSRRESSEREERPILPIICSG